MGEIKFVAYAVSEAKEGQNARWKELGVVFENKDGSLSVLADAWPVNGKLVLRKPDKK